ncbi:uncharacterized protein LOC131235550 isoform X6 [Magnolia sinica]|uniref:uncharacterized protein LOC131235550 isoform X6 n=1 Tax=Magnolia sinica TaxID=86752 RepID=UPI002658A456|nr:uncharacterized protein LOC131235550 isoform X6 [Magnolia sinica]
MSRLEAKRLRKAVIPSSLPLVDPSPANLQSTRLSPHVNRDESSCSVYIASGCSVYRVEISMEDSIVTKGKESLLIPVHAQVSDSSLVNRCPHRAEIQSVALVEMDCDSGVILGTVDSFGHLIVSRIDGSGQDIDLPTYSVLPRDCGVGEGSWAGICFSPSHWSMTAVARSFCKSIDIYDQDIHLQSFHTLLYPSSLCFLRSSLSGDDSSILAVAEGSQITGLAFSSLDSDHIYIQGVDYEVFCGQWKESQKVFSFRGDSNWLGFSKVQESASANFFVSLLAARHDVVRVATDLYSLFLEGIWEEYTFLFLPELSNTWSS